MKTEEYIYGSRYHLMKLIKSDELKSLLESIPGVIIIEGNGVPSKSSPSEKTLERFLKDRELYSAEFDSWWIEHRGKRPTWDYICEAELDGKRGLIFLEAKGHRRECGSGKKADPKKDTANYEVKLENHKSIEKCITEEITAFGGEYTGQYQIANRIAYAGFT
ncbi:MAG: hypothetical protein GXY20_10815 [Clostridiales bacterium]|nr:hypothetical protein [Clostridiales bacterium]